MTFPGWDRKLAYAIVGNTRPQAIRFLRAWQRAEGGTAAYNPLNTTYRMIGSTTYNHVGVQNYPDELAGIGATLLTLRLHFYDQLVAALRNPALSAEQVLAASGSALRTWGTGSSVIAQILRNG